MALLTLLAMLVFLFVASLPGSSYGFRLHMDDLFRLAAILIFLKLVLRFFLRSTRGP